MTAFMYFKKGLGKPVALEDLRELGLAHAFDQAPQSSPIHGRTPADGEAGVLIWSQDRLGSLDPGYLPDEQAWRKVPGRDGLYAGYFRQSPPTPGTLRRKAAMHGESVELGDGNAWTIPRLKLFMGESGWEPAYPVSVDIDDRGKWVSGGASGASVAIAALFDRLFDGMTKPEGLTADEGLDSCVELLAINYAVSKIECAMLGLLKTDGTLLKSLMAAMDWEKAIEWAQKKTPATNQPDAAG